LLSRYAALHEVGALHAGGVLPVALQRWIRGDGPEEERVARSRAADAELQALRGCTAAWQGDAASRRWQRLLAEVAQSDAERDLLVLLAALDLSPRTSATVRLLSGWADAAGLERSFAQAVLDPLEQQPQLVAEILRADHPLAQRGVLRGLDDRPEHRVQFLDLAPAVLTWLAHGPQAACRGRDHLNWLEPGELAGPEALLLAEPLLQADVGRAVAQAEKLGGAPAKINHVGFAGSSNWVANQGGARTGPEATAAVVEDRTAATTPSCAQSGESGPRLRIASPTPEDALLLARGAAAVWQRGLVAVDALSAMRRNPGEPAWLDGEALLGVLRDGALLAVLQDAALLVRGLGGDDGSRALDLTAAVRLLQPLPFPVLIEDSAIADVTTVATGLGRELRAVAVDSSFPDRHQRLSLWQALLNPDESLDLADLVRLAAFPLTPAQIAGVCVERRRSAGGLADLEQSAEACRIRVGHRVGEVAQRVTQTAKWDQVVLPAPVLTVVKEMVAFAKHGEKVLGDWGFAARYHYGLGLTALFSGPPGTGKTMLAGLISRELGLDLFRIDLSRVLSKYIGETEQRLGRLFEEGKRGGVALLFDEADSLFARRTEVKSSVDRYANLEVNFLLQKMEEYSGVVILTTNFADSIDEAFKRRIRFHAQFPMPNQEEREQLWTAMIPPKAPIQDEVAFDLLAKAYEFSGGEIKNAVLRAAFYAAVEDSPLTLELLDRAAQAECQERGRLVLRTAASLQW
jgi:hypothetical protein